MAASKCKHCGEFFTSDEVTGGVRSAAPILGVVVAVIGGLIAAGALMLDTTVSTGTGSRVHNIGLQQQQMMVLIIGLALAAFGAVGAAVGHLTGDSKSLASRPSGSQAGSVRTTSLLIVARNQKYLIWTIVAQAMSFIAMLVLGPLASFLLMACVVCQAFFVFKISTSVFQDPTGIIMGIASLIPFVGLVALLVINSTATARLQAAGVKIGLMGVPETEIEKLADAE